MVRTKLKRSMEVVDLTSDSDAPNGTQQSASKTLRHSQNSTASTAAEDYDDKDDEDDDGFVPSQEALNQVFANYELYGKSGTLVTTLS